MSCVLVLIFFVLHPVVWGDDIPKVDDSIMAHNDMSTTSASMERKDDFTAEQISKVDSTSSSQSSDEQRTLWQNVKKYRKVTYITLGLSSAVLLYGYDNVIVGTISAMPVFQYVSAPSRISAPPTNFFANHNTC